MKEIRSPLNEFLYYEFNPMNETKHPLKLSGNMKVIQLNAQGEAEYQDEAGQELEYTQKEKQAAVIVDAVFSLVSERTGQFLSIELFNEAVKLIAEKV